MNPSIIESKKSNVKRLLLEILTNKDISRAELSHKLGVKPSHGGAAHNGACTKKPHL